MFRIKGFTGCDLRIVFEEVGIFLSESGCSGLKDLQDVMERLFLRKWGFFLSESGCSGLKDLQDVI